MEPEEMRLLAQRTEQSDALDGELRSALAQAEGAAFPELQEAPNPETVEETLRLVARVLPNWRLSFEGTASEAGHWTCTLREYGTRDDDEVIGIGRARGMALALHAALLRVAASRAQGSF